MTNPTIRFKRSSISGKRPDLGNVNLGEMAINYYDGGLFTRRDTGGVGIATTVTNLTPWVENYGGTGIDYSGNISVTGVTTFTGNVGITTDLNVSGDVDIIGSITKGSGTFTIQHPVRDGHKLVHSFVEGPLCDLIYRGKAKLTDGKAFININEYFGMTPGTFEALVDSTDVFITNNNSWDQVRGKINGADLTIECRNKSSKTTVSWLVIGDRKDDNIKKAKWTDDNGKPIIEPKV